MVTNCERSQRCGMRTGAVLSGCLAGLLLLAGCARSVAPVDTKAAEQAVRSADVQWSNAAKAHDMNGVFSYYAGDAVVLPANGEMLTSRGAVQKAWTELLGPGVDASWTPMYVEASKSGDMVYDVGSYTVTRKVAKGKAVTDRGKYMAVWKKQVDGSWKAEANTWNSDLPAVAAKKG